jgi:16S rRNA (guanine966-N2)-methyltransferase
VRPTSDRVREAVFARLGDLTDARVLDLYAGTGALGIEALSRGAAGAIFVERSPAALAALRANLETLGLGGASRVLSADVHTALRRLAREAERHDLVLLDPPYTAGEAESALRAVLEARVLARGATLVIETSCRHPPGEVPGLARLDERRYGDTLVVRFEARSHPAGGEEER